MRITPSINQKRLEGRNNAFKGGGFYNTTAELESNVILSRAIIDLVGCDVPWVIMANNNQERIERARRYAIVFVLAFMSPMALLPVLNRTVMKNTAKLTKKFWSNNHKAIHLSNEFLVSAEKTKEGLEKLAKETEMGPIEKFFYKVTGRKQAEQKLNLEELLENAGGDWEKLRKKLIKAKNEVLFADFITSGVPLGAMGFINNYLTKKKTGQAGFSAEFKMADKGVVEKRADDYERNKNKRYLSFAALALGISTAFALITKHGLTSQSKKGLAGFVKKHANITNYKSGIYMSRIPFLALMVINHGGLLMASRNKTEAKDTLIRMGTGDVIFFGGDLLLASLFANISDRLFKTDLRKGGQTSFFSKFFPKTKPIKLVNQMVEEGKLTVKNKRIANGLYWVNLAVLSACMGFVIPTMINKMIKKDVKKDVDKTNTPQNNDIQNFQIKPEDRKAFEKFK